MPPFGGKGISATTLLPPLRWSVFGRRWSVYGRIQLTTGVVHRQLQVFGLKFRPTTTDRRQPKAWVLGR